MALGRKAGERAAGTPNKRIAEVAEQRTALGCDPIEGMAITWMPVAPPQIESN